MEGEDIRHIASVEWKRLVKMNLSKASNSRLQHSGHCRVRVAGQSDLEGAQKCESRYFLHEKGSTNLNSGDIAILSKAEWFPDL